MNIRDKFWCFGLILLISMVMGEIAYLKPGFNTNGGSPYGIYKEVSIPIRNLFVYYSNFLGGVSGVVGPVRPPPENQLENFCSFDTWNRENVTAFSSHKNRLALDFVSGSICTNYFLEKSSLYFRSLKTPRNLTFEAFGPEELELFSICSVCDMNQGNFYSLTMNYTENPLYKVLWSRMQTCGEAVDSLMLWFSIYGWPTSIPLCYIRSHNMFLTENFSAYSKTGIMILLWGVAPIILSVLVPTLIATLVLVVSPCLWTMRERWRKHSFSQRGILLQILLGIRFVFSLRNQGILFLVLILLQSITYALYEISWFIKSLGSLSFVFTNMNLYCIFTIAVLSYCYYRFTSRIHNSNPNNLTQRKNLYPFWVYCCD